MALQQRDSRGKKPLKRKRISQLDIEGVNYIDYKNTELLLKHVNSHGKILPSKITGVSAKRQRMLALAIKRAREMALIPYAKERIRSNRPTTFGNKRERIVKVDEAKKVDEVK